MSNNCLYFFLNEKTLDDFMDSSIEDQSKHTSYPNYFIIIVLMT